MTFQPVEALWPDVEAVILSELRAAVRARREAFAQGVHLDIKRGTGRTGGIVVVRRDGGSIRGVHDRTRISVRVWHDTEEQATDLALLVRSLFMRLPVSSEHLTHVEHQSGPLPIEDATGPQRYMLFGADVRPLPLN